MFFKHVYICFGFIELYTRVLTYLHMYMNYHSTLQQLQTRINNDAMVER